MNTDYRLRTIDNKHTPASFVTGVRRLVPLLLHERRRLTLAAIAVVVSSATMLAAPFVIAHVIDTVLPSRDDHLLLYWVGILIGVYCIGLVASYVQTTNMGYTGRRVLFALRNTLFDQIQRLPIAFFHQNKAGDLISRVNNDTDKLNQFFAQALVQLVGNIALMFGTASILLVLSFRLGSVALVPALVAIVLTQALSPWIRSMTFKSLQTLGTVSGEIQESINNFKVIMVCNRVDYFRDAFQKVNEANFRASIWAGIGTTIFTPLYGFAYNIAQVAVLGYGIALIGQHSLTIGLLIGYLLYVNNFYTPLRQVAASWSSMQTALAGLDRVSEVLDLTSDMPLVSEENKSSSVAALIQFDHVSFAYTDGPMIVHDVSFSLEPGKTYAFVGPTGGGKSTTASLMTRLYDPLTGTVRLHGRDIRAYTEQERTQAIGFITQEPFLFSGTVLENIVYHHPRLHDAPPDVVLRELERMSLAHLIERFPDGLMTRVSVTDERISLGQKQVVAFVRAVLRQPQLLILDEATANIDTVTEQQLDAILAALPSTTTKVIIAHRLNTIAQADQIFFVNGGHIDNAGSLDHAIDLLLHAKRSS